ncbi:MAG: hypothetical protein LBQ27_03135 [Clostridiales bacterium]|jgi:hypothetical protein|nr:hypothetical protein [Clostridiales bacterium]
MTIGKFVSGAFKFVINFIVILVLGMSVYYVYGVLTTFPPTADPLIMTPENTNYGVNPASYLNDPTLVSKALKGDYFITGSQGLGDFELREAHQYGLTYYPYDYSENFSAEAIYQNADMTKINLWLGDENIPENIELGIHSIIGGCDPVKYAEYDFDAYDYQNRRPKLTAEGDALVAPTFSFDDYDDMETTLKSVFTDDDAYIADIILAYWTLRIGSQVDSYMNFSGIRSTGGGTGAGGLQGIALDATMVLNTVRFKYYGFDLEKNATILTEASAKIAIDILGPLLTVADYKLTGNGVELKATGKNNRKVLSSDAYTGPNGEYERNGNPTGTAPTHSALEALYNDYKPTRRVFNDNIADLSGLRLCEFGMPASTLSNHKVDLRTIKEVTSSDSNGYTDVSFICYSYTDGDQYGFVSRDSANGIADAIGGYTANGGIVDYLRYVKLEVKVSVWDSGIVRFQGTMENWDAALVNAMVKAGTAVNTNYYYSYDYNDIMKDPNSQGVSLPELINRLTAVFA